MAGSNQVIALRNQQGDIFLVSQETLDACRIPENKKKALEQALSGEVSGYLFNANTFQDAITSLRQNNTNVGSNVLIGGLLGANSQSLSQLGVNVGSATTTQLRG